MFIKAFLFTLLACCLLLLPSCVCFAGFYLVCDPQVGVTHYEVCVNGDCERVAAQADGSLSYDLSRFGAGSYEFVVKALMVSASEWGESGPASLSASCVGLGMVKGLSIVNP